jgi:predicted AlkP superfamily phosphohydrolase/phosphomutase
MEEPSAPPGLDVDVARSRCFPHPNGLAVGGIRLNLAGREPLGVLQPGAETEAFISWLESALLEIIDERTNRPLVRRVLRTASLYSGEHLDELPDLLVEWSDETPTGSRQLANGTGAFVRATSPRIGTVEGFNEYARTGEHRPDGWMVATGPGIAAGSLATSPSLLDLAPTFAAILGVDFECDGRPIDDIARASGGEHP